MAYEEGFGRNRLQRKHQEASNIPAHGQIPGPFAMLSKARSGRGWHRADRVSGKAVGLLARALSFIGPAENPASLDFRLRRRHVTGFSLRRRWRWRRQILALHRIHQLAVFGPADRGAIVDTGGRALG